MADGNLEYLDDRQREREIEGGECKKMLDLISSQPLVIRERESVEGGRDGEKEGQERGPS